MPAIARHISLSAALLCSTCLLSACGDERAPELASAPPPSANASPVAVMTADTRSVCAVDPATDQVSPDVAVDHGTEPVALHSVAQAADDLTHLITREYTDPAQQIGYLQIPVQMAGIGMADALFLFSGLYQCTPELLQENGCNWNLPAGGRDGNLYVTTTLGQQQSYKANVRRGTSAGDARLMMTLEGRVGDAGNLVMTAYEDDGVTIAGIRASERTANGDEHITFSTSTDQHSVSETRGCNGTLSMAYAGYQLEASWTWAGNRTRGSVRYNAGQGDIELSW